MRQVAEAAGGWAELGKRYDERSGTWRVIFAAGLPAEAATPIVKPSDLPPPPPPQTFSSSFTAAAACSSSLNSSSDSSASRPTPPRLRQEFPPALDEEAPAAPTPPLLRKPGSLVCVGLDDDSMAREMQLVIMASALHADMERSISVGETHQEQDGFVDLAMGRVDVHGQPVPLEEQRPADIALLDYNVRETLLGSEVAARLRREGFSGVVCLLTGSSNAELSRLAELEGLDLALPKLGVPIKEIGAKILRVLAKKDGRARRSDER